MPVSTDELFIILLGAGETSSDAYAFCVNRPIHDIAPCIAELKNIEGIRNFAKAIRNVDTDGNDQTIIEVIFESQENMPAMFGRIAVAFAHYLGISYCDTMLFREVVGGDPEASDLSFMTLPDFSLAFSGVFPDMSSESMNIALAKLVESEEARRQTD